MQTKIVTQFFLLLAILGTATFWPISLIREPAKFSPKLVTSFSDSEQSRIFSEKLGLSTSRYKAIYYNKYTLALNRYYSNLTHLLDPNNYFFASHPREGVPNFIYRQKFPFVAIFFFLLGFFLYTRKNTLKLPLLSLVIILLLSALNFADGFDLILYPIILFLIFQGLLFVKNKKYFLPVIFLYNIFVFYQFFVWFKS